MGFVIVDPGRTRAARVLLVVSTTAAALCGASALATVTWSGPPPWITPSLIPMFVVLLICGALSWRVEIDASWATLTKVPSSTLGMVIRGLEALFTLLALQSFTMLWDGGPVDAVPGCAYPLDSHGTITCVDAARYAAVGAAQDRLAASVFTIMFLALIAVAMRGLSPQEAVDPPEPEPLGIEGIAPDRMPPRGGSFG